MDYQELKDWVGEKENQKILVLALAFLLTFLVGYGAGSFVKPSKQNSLKTYSNNNIKPQNKLEADNSKIGVGPVSLPATSSSTPKALEECLVKGNIGSGGSKVYHIKGGSFYNRVKPEMCFKTEDQAHVAGFIKSSR